MNIVLEPIHFLHDIDCNVGGSSMNWNIPSESGRFESMINRKDNRHHF